jgi:hypothetical protein
MRRTNVIATVALGGLIVTLTGCGTTGGSRLPSWTDAVEPGYTAPTGTTSDSACGSTFVVMAPSSAGPHLAGLDCGPLG